MARVHAQIQKDWSGEYFDCDYDSSIEIEPRAGFAGDSVLGTPRWSTPGGEDGVSRRAPPTRSRQEAFMGPAFAVAERDLTSGGLTKPGYQTATADLGPGKVVAVLPAHNEEIALPEALKSLAAQTRIVDEVFVIDDRSTDQTGAIARAQAAIHWITIDNTDQKAGAIDQLLDHLLPRLSDNDSVLMMDADTSLQAEFVAVATLRLRQPEGDGARVAGVGGIFFGYPLKGFLENMQENEYVRYAREIGRRRGRADVLTGTSTLFSVRALREVKRARSNGQLPAGRGVYDVRALTEDNELTLAVKHLGYRCVSPKACINGTRLMPTPRRLFYQRLRWQRGALENLKAYGVTRSTLPYIGRQLLTYLGVAFVPFFFTTLIYEWVKTGSVGWSWFWIYVTAFIALERIWAVRRGGWRSVGLAIPLVPEVVYDFFLHGVYIKALTDSIAGAPETWAHSRHKELTAPWWRQWRRVAAPAMSVVFVAIFVGLALLCVSVGIAWWVIGVLVLAGAGLAALRLSGLDPFGAFLPSGELAAYDSALTAPPQGFGGLDVRADRPAKEGAFRRRATEAALDRQKGARLPPEDGDEERNF